MEKPIFINSSQKNGGPSLERMPRDSWSEKKKKKKKKKKTMIMMMAMVVVVVIIVMMKMIFIQLYITVV